MNQAAVTIQRWYRRHAKRQHTNQTALKRILSSKRKVSICPRAAPLLHPLSSILPTGFIFSFSCQCINTIFPFQEWEERAEEECHLEQQQKKEEDRKRIREEKARLARLAAIQVPNSDLLPAVFILHFYKVGRHISWDSLTFSP